MSRTQSTSLLRPLLFILSILLSQSLSIPSPNQQKQKKTFRIPNSVKNGLASAAAAACCKTLLHPIDSVKTLQQYSSTPISVTSALIQLYQEQRLYAGLLVTVVGALPSVGLYFGVYSYVKDKLLVAYKWPRIPATALAAAIGNTVASVARVPYETIKQRCQTGVMISTTTTSSSTLSSLVSKNKIGVQMLRDIPYAMITLVVYETLQKQRRRRQQQRNSATPPPPPGTPTKGTADFLLGGFAGGLGSWLTNPMDVIKTRVQTGFGPCSSTTSIADCIRTVWEEGGAPAFLRGSVPRLVHKVPANAFFFFFYELFRSLLGVEDTTTTGSTPADTIGLNNEEEKKHTKR